MSSLVLYYSRTGNTKSCAQILAKTVNAECNEIVDTKSRKGFFGFLLACKDALLKVLTIIKPLSLDMNTYDTIYIGTPVWANDMAPAIRTFLTKNKIENKKIGLFCTYSSTGKDSAMESMKFFLDSNEIIGELGISSKAMEGIEGKINEVFLKNK